MRTWTRAVDGYWPEIYDHSLRKYVPSCRVLDGSGNVTAIISIEDEDIGSRSISTRGLIYPVPDYSLVARPE